MPWQPKYAYNQYQDGYADDATRQSTRAPPDYDSPVESLEESEDDLSPTKTLERINDTVSKP
jgi:hypothetical protein